MKKISMKKISIFVLSLIIISSIGNLFIFTVPEDRIAVVKQFGKIVKVVVNNEEDIEVVKSDLKLKNLTPTISANKGLHFKLPFIQDITLYSSKLLTYTSTSEEINTFDRRKIDIQMYAQYRIINPAQFDMSIKTTAKLNKMIDDNIYTVVIQSANMLKFDDFFNKQKIRESIVAKKDQLNKELPIKFGVYVMDIGIHRKNFPVANMESIENKMSMEIQKDSEKLMAEGDSEYNQSKSETDRVKKETIAKAVEEAANIKAEGDTQALIIYEKALTKDLEFYKFMKRMELYKEIKDTTIFMDSDSNILKYVQGY